MTAVRAHCRPARYAKSRLSASGPLAAYPLLDRHPPKQTVEDMSLILGRERVPWLWLAV